jgi:cell shape-determining protein MreD
MIHGFYFLICLVFVIIRTTILPLSLLKGFDILLPVVIFLGFFRPVKEGIPVILIFGLVMDGISGPAFGFYLSAYGWLYVILQGTKQFLQVKNVLMLSLMTVAGVLLENFILNLMIVENLFHPYLSVLTGVLKIGESQAAVGMILGPVLILSMQKLHGAWHSRIFRIFAGRNEEYPV